MLSNYSVLITWSSISLYPWSFDCFVISFLILWLFCNFILDPLITFWFRHQVHTLDYPLHILICVYVITLNHLFEESHQDGYLIDIPTYHKMLTLTGDKLPENSPTCLLTTLRSPHVLTWYYFDSNIFVWRHQIQEYIYYKHRYYLCYKLKLPDE